jgi:DNA-nicking Smr family endonuclease
MADTPSRKRPLTAEEAELWAFAMREAKGLRGRRACDAVTEPGAKPQKTRAADPGTAAPAERKPDIAPTTASRPAPAAERHPPLARFDDRERRKLSRDADLIEARLDLHGMRQREAHGALTGFLLSCVARGHRHVLVITGKGGAPDLDGSMRDFYREERGVLKRLVPQWLAEPEMRRMVISYTAAGIRHGGEGALYVRLRKTPARP